MLWCWQKTSKGGYQFRVCIRCLEAAFCALYDKLALQRKSKSLPPFGRLDKLPKLFEVVLDIDGAEVCTSSGEPTLGVSDPVERPHSASTHRDAAERRQSRSGHHAHPS